MKKIKYYLLMLLLPGSITILKAQDSTKTEFKPSGKVWGQVFGDYQVKAHSDSSARGKTQYAGAGYPHNFNSFEFRRIYVGYDYNFTEKFTAQVLLAHEGNNFDAQNNRTFLLKLANIRWKNIFKGTDLVVGQMATPAYALLSEQVWNYRSIEKTILDMRGLTKSSDLGAALQGKYTMKDMEYGYDLMAANDPGSPSGSYGIENNSYKKFYGDLFAKFLNKEIIVDVYGDYERFSQPHPFEQNKMTYKGFVAYQSDIVTVGVEGFQQMAKNYAFFSPANDSTVKDTGNVTVMGISVFARAPIIKEKLGVFARYDMYEPDTKYSSDNKYTSASVNGHVKESFFTAGFDWTPAKNVHFMPNVWMDMYSDQAKNVSGKVKSDYDLDIRLTFFWKF